MLGGCGAGITLSPQQVARGSNLAKERDLSNANFQVMDAQAMTFPDNCFDLVWACESGEHMPDKQKYIQEMERVLKPGTADILARPPLSALCCLRTMAASRMSGLYARFGQLPL